MSEKARTVYISGAITGIHNYQDHFKKAEDHIKAFGLKTLNPVEFCKGMEKKAKELGVTLEWGDYMRKCLVTIPYADAMYMLKGWEKSKGARLEHHIAQELGIEIMYQGGENDA